MDRPKGTSGGLLCDHLRTGSAPAGRSRNLKAARKKRSVIGAFGALMAVSALVALIGGAPASADENGCPNGNSIGNRLPSNLVGASFTTSVNTATYKFDSLVDRNPTGGVPGLIAYCIYPGSQPDGSVTTLATGADDSAWKDPPGFDNFSFERSDGNPSNIELDGTTGITMGTATWTGGVPADQTIVLHINDAEECNDLYGGNPGTCFVLPKGVTPPETPDVTTAPHFQDHSPVPIDGSYPNFKATVGAIVHDSATVGGTTNGTPTGTVEFRKFDNGDCSGDPADTETVTVNGGSADQTTNYGPINQQTTLSFQAFYTSDDPSKWSNASSACEKLTVVCQITFASKRTGNGDIYLMDGSAQTRLTTNPALDGQPAFFSAAGKIAFASNRDGNYEIYSMNADGTALTRLTNDPAVDTEPAWSPDGTKIAFTSNRRRQRRDLRDERRRHGPDAADQRTSPPTALPPGPPTARDRLHEQPDGNGDIYVMNADGTAQTRLTTNAAADSAPTGRPTATKIAFASKRTATATST